MNFDEYRSLTEQIATTPAPQQSAPYNNPDYINYVRLNLSRIDRWMRRGHLSEELSQKIREIDQPQQWIVITEPWCGDAAHTIPFIELVSRENPLISVNYELRDSEPFRINEYLTNGSKSIPKLVIRNSEGEDLVVWGPRPLLCQEIYNNLKAENANFETINVSLQNWYNANKGQDFQSELLELLQNTQATATENGYLV